MKINAMLYLVCFVSFCSAALATDVYKTVDDNGRVIYSDKPHNDSSEKVELNESNSLPAPDPSIAPRKPTSSNLDRVPTHYTLAITSPENESHVMPGTFNVDVKVSAQPGIYQAHKLVLTDNGGVVEGMTIENIHRGTHQLLLEVFDSEGKSLGRSEPVTIYVHRPSIN